MRGIGDKQIIVFFEVDRHNAIERCQDGEGRHLVQRTVHLSRCSEPLWAFKEAEVTEESVLGSRHSTERRRAEARRAGTCGMTEPYIHHSDENGSLKL
jgi:hypothetical protein